MYYIASALARFDTTSHLLAILLVGAHNGAVRRHTRPSRSPAAAPTTATAGLQAGRCGDRPGAWARFGLRRRAGALSATCVRTAAAVTEQPGRATRRAPVGQRLKRRRHDDHDRVCHHRPRPRPPPRPPPVPSSRRLRRSRTSSTTCSNEIADARQPRELFDNPILIGTITILVVIVAVYLSLHRRERAAVPPDVQHQRRRRERGRAGQERRRTDRRGAGGPGPDDHARAARPSSGRIRSPGSRFRSSEPRAAAARHPLPGAAGLGARRQVRGDHPRHDDKTGACPDGGTFTLNTNPRLDHNIPFVDLDTAFATFGPKTQRGLRSAVGRARRRGRRARHPVQRLDLPRCTS